VRARALGILATIAGAAVPVLGLAPPVHAASTACEPGKVHYDAETRPWALYRLDAPNLLKIATGRGVSVAVVDSGVEDGNAHLASAVVDGASMVPGDTTKGRTDVFAHGTAIAGIIAARPVKGSNVIGLAPEATIVPVRVYVDAATSDDTSSSQGATTASMAAGIKWAGDHGADVINISMSSGVDDPELRRAVEGAIKHGSVVVAAAGNRYDESEPDGARYPAAYDGVIGVSATDTKDQVTDFSVHGSHVDVTAPGQAVLTTFLDAGDCLIGTGEAYSSYATAYVSALAALLRQRFPHESAEEISYRILAGASRSQSGQPDPVNGWGMIQPRESLSMLLDPNRVGPPFPGSEAKSTAGASKTKRAVDLSAASVDPLSPARGLLGWWAVLGGGAVAVALVTRPLMTRARERR